MASRGRGDRFCHTCRTTYRLCQNCQRERSLSEFNRASLRYGRCKDCHEDARRRGYAAAARRIAEQAQRKGHDPAQHRGYQHYSRDPADVVRDAGRRRRARLAVADRAPYEPADIFERDGWTCWLCGRQLSADAPGNDPVAPTIDHVVPIATGGADTPANVRAACRSCNSRRGADSPPLTAVTRPT